MLVRREARRVQHVEALYQRLALHIADERERQQFLKTAPLSPDDPIS